MYVRLAYQFLHMYLHPGSVRAFLAPAQHDGLFPMIGPGGIFCRDQPLAKTPIGGTDFSGGFRQYLADILRGYSLCSTSFGLIYSCDFILYSILRTIVLGPKTHFAIKLFCKHRCQPWHPAVMAPTIACDVRTPNPAHRRQHNTMGDSAYTWFGCPPTTA